MKVLQFITFLYLTIHRTIKGHLKGLMLMAIYGGSLSFFEILGKVIYFYVGVSIFSIGLITMDMFRTVPVEMYSAPQLLHMLKFRSIV